MHGFVPGPMMIRHTPALLYAASGGMMASTIWLALIGWPMSIYTLKLMTLDRQFILTGCVWMTMIGVYTLNNSAFSVFLLVFFGMIGYFMRRYGYPVAAASIALILGSGLEANLRKGLLLFDSSWWTFLTRPWTGGILVVAFAFLAYGAYGTIRLSRQVAATRQRAVELHLGSGSKAVPQGK